MSCQMIRAQDWDRRVESGRVAAPITPAITAEQELVALLERARESERTLNALLVQIHDRLDRGDADSSRWTQRLGAAG